MKKKKNALCKPTSQDKQTSGVKWQTSKNVSKLTRTNKEKDVSKFLVFTLLPFFSGRILLQPASWGSGQPPQNRDRTVPLLENGRSFNIGCQSR